MVLGPLVHRDTADIALDQLAVAIAFHERRFLVVVELYDLAGKGLGATTDDPSIEPLISLNCATHRVLSGIVFHDS